MAKEKVHLVVLDRVPPHEFLQRAQLRGIRLGLLFHGLSPMDSPTGSQIVSLYQYYVRRSLRRSAREGEFRNVRLQVFNDATAGFFRSIGVPTDAIFVIPTGIDATLYGPPAPSDVFRATFIGRTEKLTKGIDILVKVVNCIAREAPGKVAIDILGSGPDSRLFNRIRGIQGVSVRGFVSQRVKRETLALSHTVLITSRLESYSMVAIEALLSGAELISTPATGPAEIIKQNPLFGVVKSWEPSNLAGQVLSIRRQWESDTSGFDQRRKERSRVAKELFGGLKMIERYHGLVQDLGNY